MGVENEQLGHVTRSWEPFDTQLNAPPTDLAHLDLRDMPDEPPLFTFPIEDRRVVGTGVTEVTDAALLRYALQLLETTCGPQIERYQTITDPTVRDTQLLAAKRYLDAKVSMGGDKTTKRRDIVNLDEILHTTEEQLRLEHEPSVQLLDQIKQQYGEVMNPVRLYALRFNVLTVAHWPRIKDGTARQVALEKARRAAQLA